MCLFLIVHLGIVVKAIRNSRRTIAVMETEMGLCVEDLNKELPNYVLGQNLS